MERDTEGQDSKDSSGLVCNFRLSFQLQVNTDVIQIANTCEAVRLFKVGKEKGAGMPAPLSCLGFVNVGCLGALGAGSYFKGYALALFE